MDVLGESDEFGFLMLAADLRESNQFDFLMAEFLLFARGRCGSGTTSIRCSWCNGIAAVSR